MAEEDVISSLPECLLLEIISRLTTTKHAIKTSTLSKRWQHVWTLLPNLIFIESDDTRGDYHHHNCYFWSINKTLNQCRTHVNLNKFKLILNVASYRDFNFTWYKSRINSWIRYAITRNVQEVNVELWDGGTLGKFRYDDDFILKNLCATQMKLTRCVFKNPIGAISWEKLKCLCISVGILDEDVIADILSGSPCLETSELNNCHGFSSIKDDIMKINAPRILSLTIKYKMDLQEILLLNVSSLVKADLDYWSSISLLVLDEEHEEELLKGILRSLGHVKNIRLGDSTSEVLSRLEAKGFQFFEGADI
nr:hypothetical protein [Tanacetum cinerariifolium]